MSISRKLAVVVAGAAVLMANVSAFAEMEVTPYGSAQYRLRFQHNQMMPDEGDGYGTFDYSNFFAWRAGTKVKVDERFSMQFQFGNDWGRAENADWNANHSPFGRVGGTHNFYAHLAYAKWNPGFMFIEAGIIPLVSNGTLDLLANSLGHNDYSSAGFNFWSEMNNSVIGLKIGVPVNDVVGVELTQAVIDTRAQAFVPDAKSNPTSVMLDLQVPVNLGALKITPEVTMVLNRNYNPTIEAGDHEMLFGLTGGFQANEQLSFSLNFGYGMISNENSQAGEYGRATNADEDYNARYSTAAEVPNFRYYSSQGMLIGAGLTYKNLGPGDLAFLFNYNSSEDIESDDGALGQIYTDLRYHIKVHSKFTIVPRYRTFTYLYTNDNVRLSNRFELMLEGSF